MYRRETSRREVYRLATILILCAILAACTPEGQAQETRPAVTQTIDGLDVAGESEEAIVETLTSTATNPPKATATPENTPTPAATSTPEATATPEASEMHEYAIRRAKEVGIDLENLDNSNNLWFVNHPQREQMQNNFENNFQNPDSYMYLFVVGAGATDSEQKYNQMLTTTGSHKILSWVEAVVIRADGEVQMLLLPFRIEDLENNNRVWVKLPQVGTPIWHDQHNSEAEKRRWIFNLERLGGAISSIAWRSSVANAPDHRSIVPGTMIALPPQYPSAIANPNLAANDGMLEEPSFEQTAWTEFINTGDPSGLSYWTTTGGLDLPFVFPNVSWSLENALADYEGQEFFDEFKKWLDGYLDNQLQIPTHHPMPQNWTPLP
jgi:hypothetical protein